jgi:phage shock protein PspC (stress-responsive transcriptional regulator)
MNNPKAKTWLLICLIAAIGAALSSFAAGSHFQIALNNGSFNFDFKVGTGDSAAATILGLVALGAGLAGCGYYFSQGGPSGGEPASEEAAGGSSGFSGFAAMLRRLTKSKTDAWLGGVCGGLGEHTQLPSWVWRLVFIMLVFAYGTGLLTYLALWICLPEPGDEQVRPGTASSSAPGV